MHTSGCLLVWPASNVVRAPRIHVSADSAARFMSSASLAM
jgi:hypothetical protein